MDFEDWFETLCEEASETYGEHIRVLAEKAPFMYEEYFEQGLTPIDALVAEWG